MFNNNMNQYLIFTYYDFYALEQEAVKGYPGHPFMKDRNNDTGAMEFCSIGKNFIVAISVIYIKAVMK